MELPMITAQEAAAYIQHQDIVALGGFAPSGTPKAIVLAIADKARKEHEQDRPFRINLLTGASIADSSDGALAEAEAVDRRFPFCASRTIRSAYNKGKVKFADPNLSQLASLMRQGVYGVPDWGILEAAVIEKHGDVCHVYPTTGVGVAPTICRLADKGIFIELNEWHGNAVCGLHDIYEIENIGSRTTVGITSPMQCIGRPYLEVETSRIKGVVECCMPDEPSAINNPGETTELMGAHVAEFIQWNMDKGILDKNHLVFQSGVGSVANAVMGAMGRNASIPDFSLYTEVFQDEPLRLLREGRVKCVSTGALTLSPEDLQALYREIDHYRNRIVVRPSEISNCPEVIARLGICAMNTALEVDIYGHANSTNVCGSMMMNGVGGSLDYTTSAALSIFTCTSTAKDGKISSIVPFCSHVDHTEHHVDAIVTEYGVADLRGLVPEERTQALIAIAHPDYRPLLEEYCRLSRQKGGQTPHVLSAAFAMHDTLMRKGDMRLTDWNEYIL